MALETLAPAMVLENVCALVIGEHAGMRHMLKLILGGLALEVHEASSTTHCLSLSRKVPRVVVVDVDPSFDQGMVVWHVLRRNPSTATIPSVFLVEAGCESIRHLATMAGATICLDKPFHPQQLRAIVERLLSLALVPNPTEADRRDARWPAPRYTEGP